jgi:hypothetical protein
LVEVVPVVLVVELVRVVLLVWVQKVGAQQQAAVVVVAWGKVSLRLPQAAQGVMRRVDWVQMEARPAR